MYPIVVNVSFPMGVLYVTILGCKIIIIMNIIVLGIGQSLRGDDAAGLEAVRLW